MKRGIVPKKFTIAVAAGVGQADLNFGLANLPADVIAGFLTYLVIEGPSNATGKVRIEDLDEVVNTFRDPKPSTPPDPNVQLEFYSYEMRIPVNGKYRVHIEGASEVGDYFLYLTLEEQPRGVL